MAPDARRCVGLHRVDEALWIKDIINTSRRRLGSIGVTGGAVPRITGASLGAHLRIPYFPGMYAMDYEVEVDAFRGCVTACVRRVVAQHAHLDLISIAAVERQLKVALIAVGDLDNRAPGRDRRPVD